MIIFDYSRVSIAGVIATFAKTSDKVEIDLARHFILNTIRSSKLKLQQEFGNDVVIACDARRYWRRDVFPYYKANRKKGREESKIDWDGLFEASNQVKEEIKAHFPYRVIEVDGAEADDVIGALCHEFSGFNPKQIVLVADDKDFYQLQSYRNVKQYDPIKRKKLITCPDPFTYLQEHIMRGDGGDGIPNFLSADDQLVTGKRATALREAKIKKWMADRSDWTEQHHRNYKRNEQLIDLTHIPKELQTQIVAEYHAQKNKTKSNLMQYFMEKRLRNLLEHMSDF